MANHGWFQVEPGEPLTLSAWLRADAENVAAELAINEAPSRLQNKQVRIGTQWQRHQFTFRPTQPYLFVAVGLDLAASEREAARLEVDAIQLERGDQATEFEPRRPVESFIETDASGNLFPDVAAGATIRVRAYNNTAASSTVNGKLSASDFYDEPAAAEAVDLTVPAFAGTECVFNLVRGRRGFFRAKWDSGDWVQSLRCTVLEPAAADLEDSPFGFNHAYPWDFLLGEAGDAGVVWWRDWSAQLEPGRAGTRPASDFTVAMKRRIRCVLQLDSEVEVLLPIPVAAWSTTARQEESQKARRRQVTSARGCRWPSRRRI